MDAQMRSSASTFGLAILALAVALNMISNFSAHGAASDDQCTLTSEDKLNNSTLSFQEFDQDGVTSSTARQLGARGCFRAAAEATEDYLVNGLVNSTYHQRVLMFHQGQYLANAGDERVAARIISGSRNPDQTTDAELDWNTYVDGTWAFLVKDQPTLEESYAALTAKSGRRNHVNARVLARLVQCFERSYLEAGTDEQCAPN